MRRDLLDTRRARGNETRRETRGACQSFFFSFTETATKLTLNVGAALRETRGEERTRWRQSTRRSPKESKRKAKGGEPRGGGERTTAGGNEPRAEEKNLARGGNNITAGGDGRHAEGKNLPRGGARDRGHGGAA